MYFQNTVQLMCPISPMLAEACKSVEKAIEKCPAGIYSEIKYDGERVQLHKKGNEFKCVFFLLFILHICTEGMSVNENCKHNQRIYIIFPQIFFKELETSFGTQNEET